MCHICYKIRIKIKFVVHVVMLFLFSVMSTITMVNNIFIYIVVSTRSKLGPVVSPAHRRRQCAVRETDRYSPADVASIISRQACRTDDERRR